MLGIGWLLLCGIKVSSFGFDAEDATVCVQRALDSGARTLVFDRQATPWVVGPLFVRSNTELVFEEGVELTAKKGLFREEFDSLVTAENVSNVVFRALGTGAALTMRREEYNKLPYTFSEHRHIFNLLGTSNVTIENLRIAESGGDGIYLGRGKGGATCRNTVIRRCDCDRNHRQGVSVITANGLLIADTKLRNTIGTAPKAGIDFEPNSSDEELVDCVLDNCDITGNDGHGVDLYLGSFKATSKPVSITVRNCRIVGNSRFARFHAGHKNNPDDAVRGRVAFENCLFDVGDRKEARFHVAKPGTGYLAVLKDCTIVEPAGGEHYAVFPCDTPYDQPLPDGFRFENVTIRQFKTRPWLRPGPKNWFERRPTNWTGRVTCVSPEGTRTETLDAAWCAKTFPYPVDGPLGVLEKGDFTRAQVVDAHPGELTPCSPLGFRERANFVFYAAGRTARFKMRYERMRDYPNRQPKGEIVLRSIAGKPVRKLVKLDWEKPDVALDIALPKAGFWMLSANISGLAKLMVTAADVPVALDCSEGAQHFIYSTGTASFFVPSGKKPEALLTVDPGEYVGIVIRDACGREVFKRPAYSNGTERFAASSPADADGFWTVDFLRPTRGGLRKYFFHVRNVHGFLFLTSDRRWYFADGTEAPGWSNVNPARQLSERAGVVWEADFSKGTNGFTLAKCDGAEGEIFFEDGRLCVRKTNYRGYLRVNAASTFSKPVGTTLKSFADAEVTGADSNYSLAFPRIVDRRNRLTPCIDLDAMGVFMWGGEKNAYLANTPPGQAARRFSHFKVNEKGGTELTPVLVIGGSPSVTRWHRWGVQDYKTAASAWKRTIAKYQSGLAGKTNLEDEVVFAQRLGADVHHTAKVVRRDGRVRLFVDGRDEVPVFYKNPGSWGQNWGDCNGRDMAKEGVRIQCFDVCRTRDWTNGFYDVSRDIRNVRERMRASPDSLTILSVYLSTPKEYAERHPTEVWRQPDGSPCVGQECHMYSRHYTSTNQAPYKPKNPGSVWPWTSCASKVYERDIKDNLTRLLEGLHREGLDKRIIGFHIGGWHDGQFSMYRSDYSIPAKAGFRDYLIEKYGSAPDKLEVPVPDRKPFYDPKTDRLAYDWNVYQHLLPFRFQERIARHLKKMIAKDVICLHWCMDVYCDLMGGSFYFDEFFASDAMDGLVSQPAYIRRPPGYTVGNTVPIASFNRRGKLYVDELDLRAWGCVPLYVKEESMGGLGFAMDLPEWQAVNHKMAGRMIAQDQGYWYYDISGGFWNPDEIERDIGASVRTCAEVRRRPKTAWKPSAAFIVDSKGFLWCNHVGAHKNPCGRGVGEGQAGLLAASGVPYDEFSYDDVVGDRAALAPYKVVVLAAFREMDAPRQKFLDGLVKAGKTVVLLAGTGGYRERVRPVGRSPEILAVDPSRQNEFMSRFQMQWMRYSLGSTKGDLAEEMRPMSFSFDEGAGTEVLARYADDGTPAVVRSGRVVAIGQTEGLTPQFFNRLVREAGGYAPVEKGLQVDMNGEFVSLVALENGHFDFKLPYPCRTINLKTGRCEETSGDVLPLDLTAGEVRWYGMD